ncbi:MAG: TonB-dependent receptor [Planctomycetes bacterium]|nr:TonB-dependent receptor [Planctomycetota bacterium]
MFPQRLASAVVVAFASFGVAHAQDVVASAQPTDLSELSLEELLNVEVVVTSASRHEQSLMNTPAAIFVISAEDIQRSGLTELPEVLRLAPGVDVARLDSSRWAVSIRGFNEQFATKLLVLVDGRSVYTPLFSGVFWDMLDMPLEEIERIEVIRGPGAALWGANAVNGIINIITKSASQTTGAFVSATAGDQDRFLGYARQGAASEHGHWRVWTRWADRGPTGDPAGGDHDDAWHHARFGFRSDFEVGARDAWTLEGDGYAGEIDSPLTAAAPPPQYTTSATDRIDVWGANVQSRWTRTLGERDELSLQAYVDVEDRNQSLFVERRATLGVDFQRRVPLSERQDLTWGAALRVSHSAIEDTFVLAYRDNDRTDALFGAFVQDEVTLVPDRWILTAGTKVEQADQSGFNVQPNLRLLYTPSERQSWWCAVSHAVRTPSQSEQDVELVSSITPGAPDQSVVFFGDRDVDPETVDALELGYRARPSERVTLDATLFLNHYRDMIEFGLGTPFFDGTQIIVPLRARNAASADAYGAELVADWVPIDDTHLSLAWSLEKLQVDTSDSTTPNPGEAEGRAPESQWRLRLQHDFDAKLRGEATLWRVDQLATDAIPAYWRLDCGLQYRAGAERSFGVGVQNIFHDGESEFGPSLFNPTSEVRTAFYLRMAWSF